MIERTGSSKEITRIHQPRTPQFLGLIRALSITKAPVILPAGARPPPLGRGGGPGAGAGKWDRVAVALTHGTKGYENLVHEGRCWYHGVVTTVRGLGNGTGAQVKLMLGIQV